MIPLVLSLILAGDYWADYHECVAPCDVAVSACYAPCVEARDTCETPCYTALNRARSLEELSEIVACMAGPDKDAGLWCVMQTGTFWDLLLKGVALTCVSDLPHWCRAYDHDGDGDVDLKDYAEMRR